MTNYSAPAIRTESDSNGLAIAGFVCGLVGLLVFGFVLGPLAIVFGAIGLSRANRGARHRSLAIAAVVLGILDIVLLVGLLIATDGGGNVNF